MRKHLTYANVIHAAGDRLAGRRRSYAANTVFSTDIVNGEVKSVDIGAGQVQSADIEDGC